MNGHTIAAAPNGVTPIANGFHQTKSDHALADNLASDVHSGATKDGESNSVVEYHKCVLVEQGYDSMCFQAMGSDY